MTNIVPLKKPVKVDHNERVILRMLGVKPSPATAETEADPRNPNKK